MNQIRSGTGGASAVLAGSLAAFPLLDVLTLLSRTVHSGELHVVGDGVEARLWIVGGHLVDRPGAAADRLFELACLDDAWFTVTGTEPSDQLGEDVQQFEIEPLVEHVGPQVAEWQALVRALPFGAIARMASQMPGSDVQIRSDQWRILSLIGAGRPVHEVVDVADGRPLETLRLVHELAEQELISVELPGTHATAGQRPARGTETAEVAPGTEAADAARAERAERSERPAGPAAPTLEVVAEGSRSAVASIVTGTPAHATDHPSAPSDTEQTAPPTPVVPVRGVASAPAGWRRTIGATTVTTVSSVSSTGRRTTAREDRAAPETPQDDAVPAPAHARGGEPPDATEELESTTAEEGSRRTKAAARQVAAYMPPPLAPDRWRPGTEPSSVSARPRSVAAPNASHDAPGSDDARTPAHSAAPVKSDA